MFRLKEPYHLFSQPLQYYNQMIEDIEKAREYVYLETFRVGKDEIGERFKNALSKKAGEGVEIKILIDYWGAGPVNHDFFHELIENKGEVRFFEKIKLSTDIFTRGHKRNHRKLLLIDDEISWIGSSNITGYNINWRESMLRLRSYELTVDLARLFMHDFRIYNKYSFNKARNIRTLKSAGFEIVRDAPSVAVKKINQRFIRLIKGADKTVHIETPYFLPGYLLRKALVDAARRGVEVSVIVPKQSDVNLVDILRNKYLGPLCKSGVKFQFYKTNNLHAKLLLVDDLRFAIGSSNFDYRSFRYMYEIILVGEEPSIARQIKSHTRKTLSDSQPFDMEKWRDRPMINKLFEWILLPFRHLL